MAATALVLACLLVSCVVASQDCKWNKERLDSIYSLLDSNNCNSPPGQCSPACADLMCQLWSLNTAPLCSGEAIGAEISAEDYNSECHKRLNCVSGELCTGGCKFGVCVGDNQCQCEDGYSGPLCDATEGPTNSFAWDERNDPRQAPIPIQTKFSELPLQSALADAPWSDTYWPSMYGGISHRYLSDDPQDFQYKLYTKEELLQLSPEELKVLSPAEKYDIYVGRYDYPTVRSEWKRTHPTDASWFGLCHGWAPASLVFKNPNTVTLTNFDNITIAFGSSDVKAYLTYFSAEYQTDRGSGEWFIGDRCNVDLDAEPDRENEPECADINAGTFHLLLTNLISKGIGFVADIDRSGAVWNQPFFKFQSQILNQTATNITVATVASYGKELQPGFDKQTPYSKSASYSYNLALDETGNIIGGDWQTYERPDFTWMIKVEDFYGYWANLTAIYAAATAGSGPTPFASFFTAPRVPVTSRRNHQNVEANTGVIKASGRSGHRQGWSIVPTTKADRIVLKFSSFSTERKHGFLKIYEGADGEGALRYVLHGSQHFVPSVIELPVSSAFVEFAVDRMGEPTFDNHFSFTFMAN